MIVYSHRGIDHDRTEKFAENSLAAFRWAAQNGLGVELDLQLTRDHVLLVAHDATLDKWSNGRAHQAWGSLTSEALTQLEPTFGPLARLSQVLTLAKEFPRLQLAMHLKGANQTAPFVQKLVEVLKPEKDLFPRILIFDLKTETARILRQALPGIGLAASVAHEYDITRFQDLTKGTLLSMESVLPLKSIFNWLWMDEWDRATLNEGPKDLYDGEWVAQARKKGFKIAMISPELHASDGHEDGQSLAPLQRRWRNMLASSPDAICTDYPARLSTSLKTS